MKSDLIIRFLLFLMIAGSAWTAVARQMSAGQSYPYIDVQRYDITVTLSPETHELTAVAVITFMPLEPTDVIVFELSENMFVNRVLDAQGNHLRFNRGPVGPDMLMIDFDMSLASGTNATVTVEYEGGFDRDRFSRMYSRDDSNAYIGTEGTYLMYPAKWFPVNRFLVDRAVGTLEVTVPLGMTVIGPGQQMPVVTEGFTETFSWNTSTPILPGSFVAGRYNQSTVQVGDVTIECFTREGHMDSMHQSAEEAGKILAYYRETYGELLQGNRFRLVEVDDTMTRQHGMSGTIFITRRELAQTSPPVRELARRIAYQWWLEAVGVRSIHDLWLADGMAYFSAARYLGNAEGKDAHMKEIENLQVLALKFEDTAAVRSGFDLGYRTLRYESVVAGKGAWIVNMLRWLMGESGLGQLKQRYYAEYREAGGSTELFQRIAESIYGNELGWFFSGWIDTTGVPEFQADYVIYKTALGFRVSGTITHDRDLFRMPVEIAAVTRDHAETIVVDMGGRSGSFDIATFTMPEKVVVDPDNKLLRDSSELQASVYLALGDDLMQGSDFVGAIREYEKVLRSFPLRSLAHFRLAEVFYEQFNLQAAANSFREALNGDMDPAWIEVWCYVNLGKIYDILGQRQRALSEYTKAVNTGDDTFRAQLEANRWLARPYTREPTVLSTDE
jgi:aminopeptidase N